VLGIIVSAGLVLGMVGYTIDRPVWYDHEFLPIANAVQEMKVEITANKLQRAKEQVQWLERIIREKGTPTAKETEDLRYWKERVRALDARLRKLDK